MTVPKKASMIVYSESLSSSPAGTYDAAGIPEYSQCIPRSARTSSPDQLENLDRERSGPVNSAIYDRLWAHETSRRPQAVCRGRRDVTDPLPPLPKQGPCKTRGRALQQLVAQRYPENRPGKTDDQTRGSSVADWSHGEITRAEAERRLGQYLLERNVRGESAVGAFLLRDKLDGRAVLSVVRDSRSAGNSLIANIEHHLIEQTSGGGLLVNGKARLPFATAVKLVEALQQHRGVCQAITGRFDLLCRLPCSATNFAPYRRRSRSSS